MAGRTSHDRRIESPTARARLKAQREPYWQTLTDRAALGYQRSQGEGIGRWLLRQRKGKKYTRTTIGLADDGKTVADGRAVLAFADAKAEATKLLGSIKTPSRFLVRDACVNYIDQRAARGKSTKEVERTIACHILPKLGHLPVAELTASGLQTWLGELAASPAMARTPKGAKRKFKRADATDPEVVRRRRSTANRILTALRAILNRAFKDELVSNNVAWGRRLESFPGVDGIRLQYLSVAESERLVNATDPDFRLLVIGALQTGARYSELCRLRCEDYNPDGKTVFISTSKSGKSRRITLSDGGAKFFSSVVAGRPAKETMFRKANGGEWRASEQARRMQETCARARLDPIGFHGLRHTYASTLIMNGVSIIVVSRNLGHASIEVTEKVYAHLSPSHVREEINRGAPAYRFERKVIGLR